MSLFIIKNIKLFVFLSLCIFISNNTYSQKSLDSLKLNKYYQMLKNPQQNGEYIQKIDQKFTFSPMFSYRNYKFIISDSWGLGNPINYFPNVNNRLGFKLRYKDFALELMFPLPSNEFIYGKTKTNSLSLNMQFSFNNWGNDFYFLRHEGFYLENAEEVVSGWKYGIPFPTRPDLRVINIGYTTHMVLSDKFSLKAALQQTEKQLKPAGGITLGGTINFARFSADSALIPLSQLGFYKDIDQLVSGSFITIAVAPGYSYTYVYQNFFITGMLLLGVGFQFQGYKNSGIAGKTDLGIKLTNYLNYRIAAGYNSDKYFGSIVYNFVNSKSAIKDSKIAMIQNGFTIQVGMRFN